jgi:squalene-hopene/tetraprenyl-beta-curcumene cyclase
MLAEEGRAGDPRCRAGVEWLRRHQEPDGSWFGRWGANYLYGTGAVVPALVRAGLPPSHPAIQRAVQWLVQRQNPDGGFGEDLRSYEDPAFRGRGSSTASQTAWALLALLEVDARSEAARRAVAWLVRTQKSDGSWDEPEFTGTGFPGDFYLRYHLYRQSFPTMALGRYAKRVG